MTPSELWQRYRQHLCSAPSLGLTLDISRMRFPDGFLEKMEPAMQRAFAAMGELEAGAIANPDENRMVGHYWLRAPELAPTPSIGAEIRSTLQAIKEFAQRTQGQFEDILCIGIGGSALGPMFVADALGDPATDRMRIAFLDNTDPDGIARVLAGLKNRLDRTLCIVTSKSGGTPETRNGMLLAMKAYEEAAVSFASHAVAITMYGSKLSDQALREDWLARFPMFDWVGGRTSELSAVGLLPAALQGLDIDGILAGAKSCDEVTRQPDTRNNPAALLALMWYHATDGKGRRDMVVLPYKDRLLLFSRYLQQLVMESLGKELDRDGKVVEQGLTVYGNKGSTDQHAYVQQLRDGVNNFFVTFVRVLESGGDSREVEPGITAGDYLHGFLLGTREALTAKGRESLMITIPRVDPFHVGVLIALFERAVGFYATLVNINAYHQPGVEGGKKAAADILVLQKKITAGQQVEASETAELLTEHLRANGRI